MMLFLTWLHVVAAVIWIGGMLFLSLVLVPVLGQHSLSQHRALLFPTVARQFRVVVWGSVLFLVTTGPVLALERGIDLLDPVNWPSVFRMKIVLVFFLIAISATHDLIVGPRVSAILRKAEVQRTVHEISLVRWAPLLARGNVLLGLAVLYIAVVLARS